MKNIYNCLKHKRKIFVGKVNARNYVIATLTRVQIVETNHKGFMYFLKRSETNQTITSRLKLLQVTFE